MYAIKRQSGIGGKISSNKSSLFQNALLYIRVLIFLQKKIFMIILKMSATETKKQDLQIHHICITDSDHDNIFEGIELREDRH